MENAQTTDIGFQAAQVTTELLDQANMRPGQILVIGCSSSEVIGGCIGKNSSMKAAKEIYDAIAPIVQQRNIFLAAQCCEHLNRAIVLEQEAAEKYEYEPVGACPWPHAGGSWATICWQNFKHPIAVEEIRAHAGLDIGGTLIGMHLRRVAVPVRLSMDHIGQAHILCARTRPGLIGGERAHYVPYTGRE